MRSRGGLPKGMVTTSEAATSDIANVKEVDVDQILKLWRASAASKAVLPDTTGARLENAFWRILQSERVMRSMNGQLLARQIRSITSGDSIRTTPMGSPRSSRDMGDYYAMSSRSRNPAYSPAAAMASSAGAELPLAPLRKSSIYSEDDGTSTPTPTSPFGEAVERAVAKLPLGEGGSVQDVKSSADATVRAGIMSSAQPVTAAVVRSHGGSAVDARRVDSFRPPPILKKDSSGASTKSSTRRSPRASKILTAIPTSDESVVAAALDEPEEADSQGSMPPTSSSAPRRATRFSEEVTVSTPNVSISRSSGERSSRVHGEGNPRPNRRNPVVHANSGVGRKRPIMMRQRSSQISSAVSTGRASTGTYSTSAGHISRSAESSRTDSAERPTDRSSDVGESPIEGSMSASLDGSAAEVDVLQQSSTNKARDGEKGSNTAENETRARFVDRSKAQHRSFTNLSSAAWRSTAVAPTAASYQASGLLAGGLPNPSAANSGGKQTFTHEIVPLKAPAPSTPDTDSPHTDLLPRTRSQLSLLLERSQAAGQDVTTKHQGRGNAAD